MAFDMGRRPHVFGGAITLLTAAFLVGSFGLVLASPQAVAQEATSVSVQNFAFAPISTKVVIGVNNTVSWTNHDSVTHTVTADDGSFGSTLAPGATFTHTFTAPGTYTYHCQIHTYMKGSVTVLGGPSTSSSSANASTPNGSGGIPEFPFQVVAVTVVTLLVFASYLVIRQTKRVRPAGPQLRLW